MPIPPANPTLDGITWRDTKANLQVGVQERIYQNLTRDISGTDHQFEDMDITNVVFRSFLPMDGDNILVVRTTGDPVTDGTSLLDTYARAIALTPNGLALSATNRVTVAIPPGVYALANTPLETNTSFVDLCGLTGNRESVLITSTVNSPSAGNAGKGTIYQTANDIRYTNLRILNTANTIINDNAVDTAGYSVNGSYPLTIFNNCALDAVTNTSWCTRLEQNYSGRFFGCRFGSRAFDKATGVGYVSDSYFGDNAIPLASGSGVFFGCYFDNAPFADNRMDVRIYNSVFVTEAFGFASLSPTTCVIDNCTFVGASFGSGGRAGIVRNCSFDRMPFGALSTGTGFFYNCDFQSPWVGANANFGGHLEGCRVQMDDTAFVVSNGAVLLDTTIVTTASPCIDVLAASTPTIVMAHCRIPNAISGSITNSIVTPYNVIDANLQ